jgi:hypothetical protein
MDINCEDSFVLSQKENFFTAMFWGHSDDKIDKSSCLQEVPVRNIINTNQRNLQNNFMKKWK